MEKKNLIWPIVILIIFLLGSALSVQEKQMAHDKWSKKLEACKAQPTLTFCKEL